MRLPIFEWDIRPHDAGCRLGHDWTNGMTNPPLIEDGVTIDPGVSIGEGSIVRRGSRVTTSVPPFCEVAGDPAKIVRLLKPGIDISVAERLIVKASSTSGVKQLPFGCSLHPLSTYDDIRGSLIYGCSTNELPFTPQRIFITTVSDHQVIRGEHAHRTLLEFLIPISGTLRVALTDGKESLAVDLDELNVGLLINTGVWSCQYKFSETASLLVLCSEPYRVESYVRDFDEFVKSTKSRQ